MIVSRLDKLLVTLIATEIAGGAFGRRQFSAASTSASGNASASQNKSSAEAVALEDLRKGKRRSRPRRRSWPSFGASARPSNRLLPAPRPRDHYVEIRRSPPSDTQITAQEKAASDATLARAAAEKVLQDAARDQALTQANSAQTTTTGTATGGGAIGGRRGRNLC